MAAGLKDGRPTSLSTGNVSRRWRALPLAFLALALVLSGSGCVPGKSAGMPIVLLTDFGVEDYRVPRLKGTIYSAYPDARIVDASHTIPDFDVLSGAFMLYLTAREFPERAVFVGGVIPDAPGERKYVVIVNNRGQVFVLPDNGLGTYVIKEMGVRSAYQVANEKMFERPMKELSSHQVLGRVAALIASGRAPGDAGPAAGAPRTLDIQEGQISGGKLVGTIVLIDHFGTALTNISRQTVADFGLRPGDAVKLVLPDGTVKAKFGTRYGDVPEGDAVALVSSLGILQLSNNKTSFAKAHGIKAGMKVEVEK